MDTIMPDNTEETRDYRPDFKALPRERLERMEAAGYRAGRDKVRGRYWDGVRLNQNGEPDVPNVGW